MNGTELSSELSRPRRFLILMSLAVFGYFALGVGVKPEAQYNGFLLTLMRPDRAIYVLWAIWGWSMWRYVQKTYEFLSDIRNDILQDVFAEDQRIALSRGTRAANRHASAGVFEKAPKSACVRGHVTIRTPRDQDWKENAPNRNDATHFFGYWPSRDGGRKYILLATLDWPDDGGGSVNETFEMQLTPTQTRCLRARAWLHAFIRLPALNDHVMPIVVALLAVASPLLTATEPVCWKLHGFVNSPV